MKKVLFTALISILSIALWAVPAVPYPVEITQPDGTTIMVRLHGDEFHHFYTLLDGTPLKFNKQGFLVKDNQPIEKIVQQGAILRQSARVKQAQRVPSKFPLVGSPRSLVLLVGFKDTPFEQTLEDFNNLLNQSGYNHNQAVGSCRDYFIAASDSVFQPQFDAFGPFTVSKNLEYYGAEEGKYKDRKPHEMLIEACQLAAESGVDFKNYDTDNDGVVDNVFLFYAGYNQSEGAPANNIWPHQSNISTLNIVIQGKRLATYACTAEHSGINGSVRANVGTFCHEFGHVLGLPDLYDINYNYYSVADWSIMCSGSHTDNGRTPPMYSAYERFYLGWLKPEQLTERGQYTLLPLATENQAYLIAPQPHNLEGKNPNPSEFFMLEYRPKTGWDAYLPGSGMLVWHIDYLQSAWDNNTPNVGPNIMRIHLEEANGIPWSERRNGEDGRASDSYPGTQKATTFIPKLHDGTVLTDHNIFDITDHNGSLSFVYQGIGDVTLQTDVTDMYFVTTVSDNKRIVDWEPQSFTLTALQVHSDTITLSTKGNFYVAIGEEAPARGDNAWKKVLELPVNNHDTLIQEVWVSYIPVRQSCEDVMGSLTISTQGATVSIALKGVAPRPTYITTPVVKPATHVSPYSFRISWKPVEDAVLYYVTLYQSEEGESMFLQGFENFNNSIAIDSEGWSSNTTQTTTSSKSEGTRALLWKNTGDYITSEAYLAPITSISYWLNAFTSSADTVGYLDMEAWNGTEWITLPEERITILASTKRTTFTHTFDIADNYTQFRLTYTNNDGNGVAMDAFMATCSRNINYIYRGKELSIDAFEDEAACYYEITNIASNTTYYYSLQSSDITKGCEEHISPLSAPLKVTTATVGEEVDKNQMPLIIDSISYDKVSHVVYLSSPQNGDMLYVYNSLGELVYSSPVYDGVSDYVIPVERLQKNAMYVIKHAVDGKVKRKQGWAKFML